jgi:RNA polymerase sigma-70 factor (sigma-E family)
VEDEMEFSAFVRSHSGELQRMAWLLTGDWSTAQDLAQSSLTKTWRRWPAIRRRDAPEAYVRMVMMRTFLAWRRRRWVGEVALGWLPERAADGDVADDVAQREAVLSALRRLPRQQRAVIVLRYFADLSEQSTADALRCRVGTVKSQASRALTTLRANAALRAAIAEGSR